eukprot:jgi/Ulvmu1/6355/UM029_0063.1
MTCSMPKNKLRNEHAFISLPLPHRWDRPSSFYSPVARSGHLLSMPLQHTVVCMHCRSVLNSVIDLRLSSAEATYQATSNIFQVWHCTSTRGRHWKPPVTKQCADASTGNSRGTWGPHLHSM